MQTINEEYSEIPGYRLEWVERLIANGRLSGMSDATRAGYLGALYDLRAAAMPPAYRRSWDISRFQEGIARAIAHLEVAE